MEVLQVDYSVCHCCLESASALLLRCTVSGLPQFFLCCYCSGAICQMGNSGMSCFQPSPLYALSFTAELWTRRYATWSTSLWAKVVSPQSYLAVLTAPAVAMDGSGSGTEFRVTYLADCMCILFYVYIPLMFACILCMLGNGQVYTFTYINAPKNNNIQTTFV